MCSIDAFIACVWHGTCADGATGLEYMVYLQLDYFTTTTQGELLGRLEARG